MNGFRYQYYTSNKPIVKPGLVVMGHEMFVLTLKMGYEGASLLVIIETTILWDIVENIYYHKNNEYRKGIYYIPGQNDALSKITSCQTLTGWYVGRSRRIHLLGYHTVINKILLKSIQISSINQLINFQSNQRLNKL